MAKKHSFFLWQSNPPKKKQKWDFAIKMVILHSTPWKTWDFFFTFQPLGFHQQEDMIGVYWYAANRLDFLSVDINHLPFTINQFFYGFFFIYIFGISLSIGTSDLCWWSKLHGFPSLEWWTLWHWSWGSRNGVIFQPFSGWWIVV